MEAVYKRRLNKSCMMLELVDVEQEFYELEILSNNKIPGCLPVEAEIADGSLQFWYDITGKQSLADYLERKSVGINLVALLLGALEQICETMLLYLLEESQILLLAEYIYLDADKKELFFVYLPGYQEDSRRSYQELLELILRKLDHGDERAVAVAYEIYQMSLQEETSLAEGIKRAAEFGRQREPQNGDGEAPIRQKELEVEPEYAQKPAKSRELWNQEEGGNHFLQRLQGERSVKGRGLAQRLWGKTGLSQRAGREITEPAMCVLPNEPEPEVFPTEILNNPKGVHGILMYQGIGSILDMSLDKERLLIGKKEDEVDICINSPCISRIHAKIEKMQEDFYIEDLNSTNGTFVNGIQLEFHQRVKLERGDKVSFGTVEFIFT